MFLFYWSAKECGFCYGCTHLTEQQCGSIFFIVKIFFCSLSLNYPQKFDPCKKVEKNTHKIRFLRNSKPGPYFLLLRFSFAFCQLIIIKHLIPEKNGKKQQKTNTISCNYTVQNTIYSPPPTNSFQLENLKTKYLNCLKGTLYS